MIAFDQCYTGWEGAEATWSLKFLRKCKFN